MKKRLVGFSGLNNVVRPDMLKDDELQEMINYEILGDGYLHKRTKPTDYNFLSAKIKDYFSQVKQISKPYYPIKTLDPDEYTAMSATNSFALAIYGKIADGSYKTYLFYQDTSEVWAVEELADMNDNIIEYTADSVVRFSVGESGIIITDGVNRAHRIFVDSDGIINTEILGISTPITKIEFETIDPEDSNNWEEDTKADSMEVIGLVQAVYTIVTEDGEESNPSPVSETVDLQYLKYTVADVGAGIAGGDETRWINKIAIGNLTVPDMSVSLKNRAKYFNVYYRVFRYSAGLTAQPFQFAKRFDIIDKTTNSTANNYALTSKLSLGQYADYEKDRAPIAADSVQISGIVMVSDCQTKSSFPYEFDHIEKIKINNTDASTYVDAIVRIRLYDKDSGESKKIADFDVSTYGYEHLVTGEIYLHEQDKLRIYDTDMTTPINVIGIADASQQYIDVWVKIPQLEAGMVHTLYFCFGGDGVDAIEQVYDRGKWFDINFVGVNPFQPSVMSDQKVFNNINVFNSDNSVCQFNADNKSDVNHNGLQGTNRTYWTDANSKTLMSPILLYGEELSLDNVETAKSASSVVVAYTDLYTPKKGYVRMNIKYSNTGSIINLFKLAESSTILSLITDNGDLYTNIQAPALLIGVNSNDEDNFIVFSWDYESATNNVSIFIYGAGGTLEKVEITDATDRFSGVTLGDIDAIIGHTYDDTEETNIQIVNNRYLSANNDTDVDAVYNMANFMPATEDTIGYSYSATTHNNLITFEAIEKVGWQAYNDMIKWGSGNFPDLYFKRVGEPILRITSIPSSLQERYNDTILIFTRNSVFRFVLQGTPDGWAAITDSMIEEFKNLGLYAPNSLASGGNKRFWLSESGIVKFDEKGLTIISKNRVSTSHLTRNAVGFYNEIRQQYIVG